MAEASAPSGRDPPIADQLKIKTALDDIEDICLRNRNANGLAIITGTTNAQGIVDDVQNMYKTFHDHLKFAVLAPVNPSYDTLACLIQAVSQYDKYPDRYRVIAFYSAGHGGIDEDGHPYIKDSAENKLFIEEGIVSPFHPDNSPNLGDRKRLFFFDCCLSYADDESIKNHHSMRIPRLRHCLVAFATSVSEKSSGDIGKGGIWTRYLHENLKTDASLTYILDKTNEQVVKETQDGKVQGPHYVSGIGPINLRALNPSLSSEPEPQVKKKEVPPAPKQTLSPNPSGVEDLILNKTPQRQDVFKLLKSKSTKWDEIARELCVDSKRREELRKDVSINSDKKLEEVLTTWIDSETTPVTWKTVIEKLDKELALKKMAKDVKKYLKRQDVVEKYSEMDDYEP